MRFFYLIYLRFDFYTYFTICVKKLENTNILKNRAVFYACSLENTYSSYFLIKKKLKNKKRGGAKEKNKYIKDEGRVFNRFKNSPYRP
ncbi:hypothetical protein PFNF135_01434 [Plasmodium falciparum NF135/5.C10]|uniref:Uncharacterized protein n=1 Tax=Plasmodium falciparum NF135/5.C10 TaxID=1036726 RepID=W4IKH0_PLAFA|nr:hypothetical protein PFNF135_01434 [Plasmodium falciparum NF135/5.C10]